MTPKQKAEVLFHRFNKEGLYQISPIINRQVRKEMIKQCALICVDEIYKLMLNEGQHLDDFEDKQNYYSYWEEVKNEIEKL